MHPQLLRPLNHSSLIMINPCLIFSQFIVFLITSYSIISNLWKPKPFFSTTAQLPSDIPIQLHTDAAATKAASNDYGNIVHENPSAVLYPSSIDDIIHLVKLSYNLSCPFTVAARGCGHSVRGQAMASKGVVVDMASLRRNGGRVRVSWNPAAGYYADCGGEQRWIDVLTAALEHGLAPVSYTDYLYLSVGGTLSNGGISGQSFLYGPQISNVLELDVITGKGEFITCSKERNSELFLAVLGGLGQFGIITRARIVLRKAPTRAKWVRLIYSNFTDFTRDQEHLISSKQINGPNYVEGSLITDQNPPNNWRSSFYSPSDQSNIHSVLQQNQGLLYSIEIVKYYDHHNADTIDQETEALAKHLKFIPGLIFTKDVTFLEFLTRVRSTDESESNSQGQSMEAHPWLNLFIPKSRILDFNHGVFLNIIRRLKLNSGPILFYPLNRKKWDDRMSAVTPDEDIFYTLGLLPSSRPDESHVYDKLNHEIVKFCEKSGININQYLPHHKSKEDWMEHFGPKWENFEERKLNFYPKMILSPGQRIFTSVIK